MTDGIIASASQDGNGLVTFSATYHARTGGYGLETKFSQDGTTYTLLIKLRTPDPLQMVTQATQNHEASGQFSAPNGVKKVIVRTSTAEDPIAEFDV